MECLVVIYDKVSNLVSWWFGACLRWGRVVINYYRKISNIRRTKSLNLNVSRLVLQLSFPNPMKSVVKPRMKMQLEQRRQVMLQLHLSDGQFFAH